MEEADARAILAKISHKITEREKPKSWPEVEHPTEPENEKVKALKELLFTSRDIADISSNYRIVLRKMASIIIGEEIPEPRTLRGNVSFVPLMMVVPTRNINGHSYTIGEPALSLDTSGVHLMRMSGSQGNDISRDPNSMRPATLEEIRTFFSAIPYASITSYLQSYLEAVELFTVG